MLLGSYTPIRLADGGFDLPDRWMAIFGSGEDYIYANGRTREEAVANIKEKIKARTDRLIADLPEVVDVSRVQSQQS
jgi:hypothetical protein